MGLSEIADNFKRGVEALKAAEKFIELDAIVAANRVYIAGENLAYSLLLAAFGSSSKDHGKIWSGIQELFEKGILKENYKPLLQNSYRIRMKGDYGRVTGGMAVVISKPILRNQINSLKEFAKEAKKILSEKGLLKD